MKLHSLLFLILLTITTFAQKYTISGYVTDLKTGEKLIGASVYDATALKGTITNNYGFFSLTLPAGPVKFTVSFIGYNSFVKEIDLKENISLNVDLDPSLMLQEVVVVESRSEKKVKTTEMSSMEMPIKDIKTLPVLLGEVDVLKAIQLMPGVQSGNEGTSGFYVRGGGPDQNLILLDGVPVYNADHLFGFFSVFNADAISNVKLIKGGFPARYGGRLSSVLDIRMKEGNKKEFHGEASIGLISSKLTLEGPVIKDKTSFIVSARRTYIDILARPLIKSATNNGGEDVVAGYYFYDLNGKINHKFSDRSHLYLSAYTGRDKAYSKMNYDYFEDDVKYQFKDDFKLQWGNITTAARWNYEFNKKLFSNTTLTYSKYKFLVGEEFTETTTENDTTYKNMFGFNYFSGIEDVAGRIDFDYIPNTNHYVRFGINHVYHTFNPGINTVKISFGDDANLTDTAFGNSKIYAHEFQAYMEDDVNITPLLKANIGAHYSGFYVNGTFYQSLQPRVSARYMFSEKFSVKAAYSRMNQYILLLTNSGIGLPTDLWLPVTDSIKPQNSTQYVLGGVYALKKNLDFSIEVFYKDMNNLIEYKEGASFFDSGSDWETKVEMGKGWSYGAEFLLHKHIGKLTGWIGYTFAKTERQFENISFGKVFPYRYDRRHDISVTCTYQVNENVDVSGVWVFGTGNAVTLGTQKYGSIFDLSGGYWDSEPVEYFPNRNNFRMLPYHRMDLGVNFKKKVKLGLRTWSIGIYNVYNRKNPFYMYFGSDNSNNKVLKQVSLFPMILFFQIRTQILKLIMMKSTINIISKMKWAAFVLVAGLISCEKIIDIDIPEEEKKIVVNSIIAEDSLMMVNVSKSLNILDKNNIKYLEDAIVKLYENNVYVADMEDIGNGNYLLADFHPESGREYMLKVSYSGLNPATATARIPEPVEVISIDTASIDLQGVPTMEVTLEFNDPSGEENFYIITAKATSTDPYDTTYKYTYPLSFYTMDINVEDYLDVSNGLLMRDKLFDGKNYKLVLDIDENNLWGSTEVEFQLQSVSKDYYLYALSYTRHRRTMNNPFAEPVQVYTNITDGFGIFGGLSVSVKTVLFEGYGGDIIYE